MHANSKTRGYSGKILQIWIAMARLNRIPSGATDFTVNVQQNNYYPGPIITKISVIFPQLPYNGITGYCFPFKGTYTVISK